jgi:hypothetical protein
MSGQNKHNSIKKPDTSSAEINSGAVFDDPESRRNIVGLFDLLLKIDRRLNAQNDDKNVASQNPQNHD